MRVIILILVTTSFCYSNDSTKVKLVDPEQIQRLEDNVKEIRRDQLNYKIEKDLLKETYSSNYTTVQIIISLILGLFAILGYLGLRGIITLKREYDLELARIKDLKVDFETKLKNLTESQDKFEKQIVSIDNLNEQQSLKIKLLEIKEKVTTYFSQRSYQRALEYTTIGLDITKDELELLRNKANILLKLRSYPDSIEAHKRVISLDSNDESTIKNLAELYLLVGQIDNYEKLVSERSEFFTTTKDQVITYLEAFKLFQQNKFPELTKFISSFLSTQDLSIMKQQLGQWGLEELLSELNLKQNSKEKNLLINFVTYLNGGVSGEHVKTLLTA